jgi:hypothetical protein
VLDSEVDLAESARQGGQLRESKHVRQLASPGVRIACASGSFDQEQPKINEQLPIKLTGVFTVVDRVLNYAQGFAGIAVRECRDEAFHALVPAQAKGSGDVHDSYRGRTRSLIRDCRTERQLFQETKCVTQATGGMTRDQPKRVSLDGHPLERRDGLQAANNVVGADASEVEPLAAGDNSWKELLRVGGGQDETSVRRRLFQRLEEGVCGCAGDLVRFVDDVDL